MPNSIWSLPKQVQNFSEYLPIILPNIAQDFLIVAKVAKFRQIWSHWLSISFLSIHFLTISLINLSFHFPIISFPLSLSFICHYTFSSVCMSVSSCVCLFGLKSRSGFKRINKWVKKRSYNNKNWFFPLQASNSENEPVFQNAKNILWIETKNILLFFNKNKDNIVQKSSIETDQDCWLVSASVTSFSEISPLWQNFTSLMQILTV